MKWLWLVPFWAFFIYYLAIKPGEKESRFAGEVQSVASSAPDIVTERELAGPQLAGEKTVSLPREERVAGMKMKGGATQLRERVELLPVTGNAGMFSPLWPMGRKKTLVHGQDSSGQVVSWKLFESEEISFYFPDIASLRVEVVEESLIIPMFGGIYYAGKGARRWYRIVSEGKITWAAFAIGDAVHFDDGKRYPVSESLHRTMGHGGGVARFALDDQGRICRAEWRGNGKRVSMLAWQHGGAHRDDYASLVASVELGNALRIPFSGLQKVIREVTMTTRSRIGLLEPGMRASDVQKVLGKPVGISGNTLIFHSRLGQGDCYFRVQLGDGGVFKDLKNDWRVVRKDPPLRGTIEWMQEKTQIRAGKPGGIGYDIGALSEEEGRFIVNQLMRRLPTASGSQWSGICRVLENLAELGLQDEQLINLLRVRFLEEETPIRPAMPVLWRWSEEGSRSIFIQKARDIISALRWQATAKRTVAQTADDLRVLLDFIGEAHSGAGKIIALMAQQSNVTLRETGFSRLTWLKGEQLRVLALEGLSDLSEQVRLYCADVLASGVAEPKDENFLRERLGKEQSALIREKLSSAVAKLRKP